jgi:hypothetical protein
VTFEENPLIFIVFVVLTVEGWNLAKAAVRSVLRKRRETPAQR